MDTGDLNTGDLNTRGPHTRDLNTGDLNTGDLHIGVLDRAAAQIVAGYLAALESHLPSGRRSRTAILTEIADGLGCAVADRVERGESPAAAARLAVAEFGEPRTVAAAFIGQLARAGAHRVGLALVATGPVVGSIWVAATATGARDWPSDVVSLLTMMPQYPVILAITIPAAMIALTGAGRAGRHLTIPIQFVTAAAFVATIGCMSADVSLLSAAFSGQVVGAAGPAGLISLAAVTASLVRLTAAAWAGYRIGRLRSAVPGR